MAKREDVGKKKSVGVNEFQDEINQAWRETHAQPAEATSYNFVVETYPDDHTAIVSEGEKYFKIPYSVGLDGKITFGIDRVEVERKVSWDVVVKALRAKEQDEVINFGDSVKAVKLADGTVKLGGYLVRFSTVDDPDVTGDYFTKSTDYGDAITSDGWFNHRIPVSFNNKEMAYKEKLGKATLTKDEIGVFAEICLGARNEYEKFIADLGLAGKLGWSSGTASHLVERKSIKDGVNEITAWPLGLDASLTPTPAEPRNSVISLKSLPSVIVTTEPIKEPVEADKAQVANGEVVNTQTKTIKEIKMADEVVKEVVEKVDLQQLAKDAATEAIKAFKAAEPAVDTAGTVKVILDEADRPFKSLAEMASAVKMAAVSGGRSFDARLKKWDVKSTGANESVPSDGGFLVEPTIAAEIIKPIHEEGPFSNKVRKLPVGSNSNYGWINGIDETSRATGSRWGGVQGYRLAEGDTKIASRPKFRRINWELKKYVVLMYATDELLADSSQFNEIAKLSAGEELNFMVNDDILNGLGTGGPLGILNSGAVVTVTRDTGSAIKHADILAMWQRLLPRSRKNAEWFINSEAEPQLDGLYFTGAANSVLSPYVSYGPDGVMHIMGKPVNVTEFNAALNTKGDILLADMSEYLFWEKGEVQAATSIHIAFLTDEQAFRFVYRCDGKTTYASPITPFKGTLTQSAFVVLGSAT